MTSDFDNDEIQDSAFPVDFNDDTSSLDLYGVWVKSGPRDADLLAEKETAPATRPDLSPSDSDYSDISLLPDLPDFSGLAETEAETLEFPEDESLSGFGTGAEASGEEISPASEISASSIVTDWDDANITFDEIVPDYSAQDTFSEVSTETAGDTPSFPERAPSEPVSESEFETMETVDIASFTEVPEETEGNLSDTEPSEIIFEDILSEELESSSPVTKQEGPSKTDTFREPAVSRVFESVDIFEIDEPEMSENVVREPVAAPVSVPESTGIPDELPEFSDSPEFDLDDSFGTESVSFDTETFELEGPETLSTDTSDLDSFISDFNESGGTAAEEKDKLFSGLDPVDIDLDFDESFISDAEKIKATGSAVTKSEFMESEFGVEMIEETGGSSETEFEESTVIDADFLMSGQKQAVVPDVPSDIQDTDEFDELLESLDRAPSPVQAVKQEESAQKTMYDLSVIEDEGEEILDIPVIKDYNSSDSGPAGESSVLSPLEGSASLDFDDISAVEQELNDSTPDTGDETVNDKSTQLLMMIADELSSIKQELSTLKTEIAGFKASGNQPELGKSDIEDTDSSGFFNDDDTDETIALTGDELNNILITADFTEEKNEETDSTFPAGQDTSFGGEGEMPEINFETPVDLNDFNGFSADLDESDIPDTLPDSIFEATGLESPIPVEPAHVNKIDEDTSYLEGSDLSGTILDDLSIDESDLEIIDFNDEKLEEPELDEFNLDLSAMDNAFPAEQDVAIPREEASPDALFSTETELSGTVTDVTDSEPAAETETEFETPPVETAEVVLDETVQPPAATGVAALPVDLKDEIKSVLAYMDQLLESLPEEKIEEFARSEHFEVYRKLFEELGIS